MAILQSSAITGSLIVSGSSNNLVQLQGSGSTVLTVNGASGQLFGVSDDLTDSLFSVNTIAGLPVIEAFADNTVKIGTFGNEELIVSESRVYITSASLSGPATFSGVISGNGSGITNINASNISSGTVSDARLPGSITSDITGNAATATALATPRNIALTGAVTGNANFDGSSNISITTTATSDPTLTLAGDATGTATFTNLGNATLTVTVVNDSHTHDGRYYTESESDSRFVNVTGDTMTGTLTSTATEGLRVDSSTFARINLDSNNNWSYVRFADNGTTSWDIATYNGGNLEFRPSGGNSNRMIYDSSGNLTVANNLTVGGIVTAQEFHTEFVSASIVYQSGSTKFGDTSDDVHEFTGSVDVLGSMSLTKAGSTHNLNLYSGDDFADSSGDAQIWITSGIGTFKSGEGAHLVFEGRRSTRNFYFKVGDVASPQHIMHHGGNVGIGTGDATPSNTLQVNGGIDANTLNTGQGDNELYAMNQNVRTTDGVTFSTITGNGSGLTSLNASNLSSGTVSDARLPGTISSDITGNAATATKWAAPRTITLGGDLSGNVSIDGSANVTLTAVVADDSHNHTISNVDGLQTALDGKLSLSGGTITDTLTIDSSESANHLVIKAVNPTINLLDDDSGADDFYIHVNSNNFYILTNRDGNDVVGGTNSWESPHPLQLEADTNIAYTFGQRIFNEAYHPNADKWTTARTITLGGDLSGNVSIDGSANVTLSATVANDSHTHDGRYYTETESDARFLGISAKAADSDLLDGINSSAFLRSDVEDQATQINIGGEINAGSSAKLQVYGFQRTGPIMIAVGTTSATSWDNTNELWLMNSSGNLYIGDGQNYTNRVFNDSYHPNADKWTTPRTITLGGDLSGNVSIDGSDNVTLTAVVADNSHSHNLWTLPAGRSSINVDTAGSDDFWQYIHSTSTTDGTFPGSYFYLVNFGDKTHGIQFAHTYGSGANQLYMRAGSDNGSSENGANTYKNWRRILTTSDEGSGNGIDADLLDGQHGSYYQNASNLNAGTVADARLPGTISSDITGNAATATKWATARTITLGGDLSGNVSIDGSANATLTATIAANSVALGTDTTGNYVGTITAGTGIDTTGATTGEGIAHTISVDVSDFMSNGANNRVVTATGTDGMNAESNLTFDGTTLITNAIQTRAKIAVWNTSTFAIGMKNGYNYGHIGTNEYAMSFQMDNTNGRGWWWGHNSHNDSQGAMSLTNAGLLTVAKSVSIGEGESVTSPSSTPLYVEGSGSVIFDVQGSLGQLFSVTDDLTGTLFSVNDISGIPILTVDSDDTVTMGTFGANTLVVTGSRVGIGTAEPALRAGLSSYTPFLHINSNTAGVNPTLHISADNVDEASLVLSEETADYGYGARLYYQGSGNNFFNIEIVDNNTATDRLTIDRYGRVGLSTVNPTSDGYTYAQDLVIKGGASTSDGAGITINSNGKRYGIIAFGDAADTNAGEIFYDHTSNIMNFRANGSANVMTLDGSGNVTVSGDLFVNDYARIDALRVGTTSTDPGDGNLVVEGSATVQGNLSIGADGTTPLFDMLFDDHATGAGWDTRIQIGLSDDFAAGTGVFPTYLPAGAYGIQFQANSDGVFFGMEEYSTGNYRPIIQWGDDDSDTPFRIKHENGSELEISYNGNVTTTGDLTVSGGDIVLGGTGRIQGIDTVSAGTDAANKSYVDAHTYSHTHDDRYFTETESDARFLGISAKAADSDLLDGLNSSQFLRSDASDSTSGNLDVINTGAQIAIAQFRSSDNYAYINIGGATNSDSGIIFTEGGSADTATNRRYMIGYDASDDHLRFYQYYKGDGTTAVNANRMWLDGNGNLTVANDLFVNDYARIDALRVGTTSTDPGDGNLYVEGETTSTKATIGDIKIGAYTETANYAQGISSDTSYLLLQRDQAIPIQLWGSVIESRKDHYFGGSSSTAPTSISTGGTVTVGNGTSDSRVIIDKADNNVSDHLIFEVGGTRVGEIGSQDTTWLRINQVTSKNIYTPRYIRADGGFFVDSTDYGINGSGRLLSPSLSGTYSNNLTFSGNLTIDGAAEFNASAKFDGDINNLQGTGPAVYIGLSDGLDPQIQLQGSGGSDRPHIDFSNSVSEDFDARIILDGDNVLTVDGAELYVDTSRVFHDTYHPNADKWTTARTITLGGDLSGNVSIDGSANVTLSGQVTTAALLTYTVGQAVEAQDALALDGQDPSYYLNYSNFTNKPTIGNATITLVGGDGITDNPGAFTTNQTGNESITLSVDSTVARTNAAETFNAAITISDSVALGTPLLVLDNDTNGGGAAIQFNDNSTDAQPGLLTYYHVNTVSEGGGASFHFTGEPDTVLVVGNGTNTGRIAVDTNSAAEVAYGFRGDVDTGMYRPGADQLSLVTGGTRRLNIQSDGNIGIGRGTSGASARLHIESSGEIARFEDSSATGSPYISFFQTSTRRGYIQMQDASDNMLIDSEYGGLRFSTGGMTDALSINSSGQATFGGIVEINPNGYYLYWNVDASARNLLRIDRSGTQKWDAKLETNGDLSWNDYNGTEYFRVNAPMSKSSGTFRIKHPDPSKNKTHFLQHSFVESPTAGDNIYRWQVEVVDGTAIVELPDYYKYLNENDQVWVSPFKHFGQAYGEVNEEQTHLTVTANADGLYNVLCIGTRKDVDAASAWEGTEVLQPEPDGDRLETK